MLTDWLQRIKRWAQEQQRDLLFATVVFLMGLLSFGLGRLSASWPNQGAIVIESSETNSITQTSVSGPAQTGKPTAGAASITEAIQGAFVASKSGSAYHLPDCPSAKRIKPENRIWFQTRADAERAGYRAAANCPGLISK